jgi:hypothetical protein
MNPWCASCAARTMIPLSEQADPITRAPRRRRRGISIAAVLAAVLGGTAILVPAALTDPHYRAAYTEAGRVLLLFRAPPGSVQTSKPSISVFASPLTADASDHFIDRTTFWTTPHPVTAVLTWVKSHPPRGMTQSGGSYGSDFTGIFFGSPDGASYVHEQLEINVAPNGNDASYIRVDSTLVWISTGPTLYTSRGPSVHLTLATGCPRSILQYQDVSNPPDGLRDRLLPSGRPRRAMICAYGFALNTTPVQRRQVNLGAADAQRFADMISALHFKSMGRAVTSCPNDQDLNDIFVFKYANHADVDLWYHASGCPYLRNGFVFMTGVGNPPFYEKLIPFVRHFTNRR